MGFKARRKKEHLDTPAEIVRSIVLTMLGRHDSLARAARALGITRDQLLVLIERRTDLGDHVIATRWRRYGEAGPAARSLGLTEGVFRELTRGDPSRIASVPELTKRNLSDAVKRGYSHRQLGDLFDVSHATITRRLMAWGLRTEHTDRFPDRRGVRQPPRKRRRGKRRTR